MLSTSSPNLNLRYSNYFDKISLDKKAIQISGSIATFGVVILGYAAAKQISFLEDCLKEKVFTDFSNCLESEKFFTYLCIGIGILSAGALLCLSEWKASVEQVFMRDLMKSAQDSLKKIAEPYKAHPLRFWKNFSDAKVKLANIIEKTAKVEFKRIENEAAAEILKNANQDTNTKKQNLDVVFNNVQDQFRKVILKANEQFEDLMSKKDN